MTIGMYETPIWSKKGWLQEIKPDAAYDVDDLLPAIRNGLSAGWSTSQAGPGRNAGWPAAPRLKAGRGQTWSDAKSRPWRPAQPVMFIPTC